MSGSQDKGAHGQGVGFGSGDYKGRGALFDSAPRNRQEHHNRMDSAFYCKVDHSLDGFVRQYGRPSYLAQYAVDRAPLDTVDYMYDHVYGPGAGTTGPCFKCRTDSWRCEHRRTVKAPKALSKWPLTTSSECGWRDPIDTLIRSGKAKK
ncbi:Uncharacterized protein PBTT_06408 [Plasmodiophora brassicae]|uniref:Uncharacterized protein n=1 Tax=Plasmodiophora brassicae TaxID=37360 RepID=A0A0G4IX77_PLABS|nr:hypothetical protein PBRA_007447 [Plasmodiophora brassicae]